MGSSQPSYRNLAFRLSAALTATVITLFLVATLALLFFEISDWFSVAIASPFSLFVGWSLWRATAGTRLGPVTSILVGSLVTGASAFALTLLFLFLFAPEANQGPLLAIFITGPVGLLVGGIAGFVLWMRKRDSL